MNTMTRRSHLGLLAKSAAAGFATRAAGGSATAGQVGGLAEEFMGKFGVPGLSIAIAKDGHIVRRETFGFADLGKGEALAATHRFRIASVSKPITAVAVFHLIEHGRLNLEGRVFGRDGLLGVEGGPGGTTLRHLLTHTSGGWQNDAHDPMFQEPDLDRTQLIDWTLKNLPPENAPGQKYAYSNFGYCLLGRIIEKVTGQGYEEFVREKVLRPCGIAAMEVGGGAGAERLNREVEYYMDGEPSTSALDMRRMDSHGGWVGTPSELVEFAMRVDKFADPEDILKDETVEMMTERRGVNPGYACGWSVNEVGNWWHGGSLPGLTSLLVRTSQGYCWAACANTRAAGIDSALDRLMWKIVRAL